MSNVFGAPRVVVNSVQGISPQAVEGLAQMLEQRGLKIPISNITGFQLMSPKTTGGATYGGSPFTTTSTSYVSLVGSPTLTNLRAGYYVVIYGAYMSISSAAQEAWVAYNVNGVDPNPPVAPGNYATFQAVHVSSTSLTQVWGFDTVSLKQDLNTLDLRVAVTNAAATLTLWKARLIVLRMGQTP